jgi:uracil-DNA glycosylase
MSVPTDFFERLTQSSIEVRARLRTDSKIEPYIDDTLPIPQPFCGRNSSPIKLVVIGQDPTVGSAKTRAKITHALMLNDEKAKLTVFLGSVCAALGITLKENVYATNLCKCFFTEPPRNVRSPKLIRETGPVWLDILRQELALFQDAAVISLGEPVLDVLLKPAARNSMKWFWAHHPRWKHIPQRPFQRVEPDQSTLGRRFYPFIHINSDFGFYGARRPDYQQFIRGDIEASANLTGGRLA